MISVAPKAIFFDVNETLLDMQPVKDSVAKALGGRTELVPLWFTTLLQYSLVMTVGDRYAGFGTIAAAALQMVAEKNGMSLSEEEAEAAVKPVRSLPPHPEVADALQRLRAAGFALYTLTNSAADALEDQMKNSGLKDYFAARLSVDGVQKFKPHREVYAWAAEQVGIAPENCLLVAAHGWDVAGAGWAGLRTAFVQRPGHVTFPLADPAHYTVKDLAELADVLTDR
ncbi:haloacid dehalogenase type II [Lewinella sp. IMCC34191]|uniref:haloacid dehalogenase type II n=1 Tax=Lewinella sp. IMCC34191 TaxID=2259172 RepID=UPI000E2858B2|nr:haloacid dehalogenase type II [Lewinella sp. IMCC34191]